MKVDLVDTRDFQVPMGRVRKWAQKLGIPKDAEIVPTNQAETSISTESDPMEPNASTNLFKEATSTFDSGKHFRVVVILILKYYLVPELENSDMDDLNQEINQPRVVSTPMLNGPSKDEFNGLAGMVKKLSDQFFKDQDSKANQLSTMKDTLSRLESKLESIEGNAIPELKVRIKDVKKKIPAEATLPNSNKLQLEGVKAGLERVRAQVAVLEQKQPEQKFKLSSSDIAALFGEYTILFFDLFRTY